MSSPTALESIVQRDPEYTGQVSRALHSGHDFGFYLAQLNTQITERLRIQSDSLDESAHTNADKPPHYYRHSALQAKDEDFQAVAQSAQLLQRQNRADLLLWMCLHPDPLSLHNDSKRIDPEVIANCELHAQRRQQEKLENKLMQFAPNLAEIIPQSQAALA
ncbi:VC2046/SO_2500 family protein [Alteromonas flava]|uniref:VC2046/SO_2500 family protein n=1 Tax=Alteromonas flava TaxID=2048003 RepID=UPI000C284BF2|nr:VC2046/SO_2500 family protein [Alteromonas flava]